MKFVVDDYAYELDDDVLARLKTRTRRSNKAEVVRDAIAIYNFIVERTLRGERFFVGANRSEAAVCDFSPLRKIILDQASSLGTTPPKHSDPK